MFPRRMSEPDARCQPECISLQDSDQVLEALASETGRHILTVLRDEALPPSEIADAVGTSIQNITYHLTRLEEAGIVEVTDTWYSSRGREMDVYAVTADPVVVHLQAESPLSLAATGGPDSETDRHRSESQ